MICDAVVLSHLGITGAKGGLIGGVVASGVVPDSNACGLEGRLVPDSIGKSFFLVGGKGIHGIENDGFDARFPCLFGLETVIKNGI